MKTLFTFLSLLLAFHYTRSQILQEWTHRLGSTGGDIGYSITADASGNVIITGNFVGTVDVDPGPAVVNLTANGSVADAYLAKYTPAGTLIWAFALGSTDSDIGETVATDGAGNIYLGISFGNTIDMDPGAGVASFTSPGFSSSIIAKYDANGNYLWGFMLASLGSSGISDIQTDASNNVFFTGSFHGTVDFDPGPAVNNLVSNGNSDIFFAKYDANGNYLLAKSFGAGAFDTGSYIELDGTGAIIVSGYYRLTVDFDPGPGVANITAVGTLNDVFFAKYDAAGNYVWAGSIGSTSNDIPGGMSVDASGNVVVSGGFSGTVDFDPGAGTANLTALGRDIFIAKYDANRNYQWAKGIGSSGTETTYGITGDGSGGFYMAGEFSTTVDFDPDGGTANLISNGSTDIFIARYTTAGALMSAGNLGGTAGDLAMDVALVDADHVVVTGYFMDVADFDPGPAVNNLTSAGIFDVFYGKYRSTVGPLPGTLSSFTSQCTGNGIEVQWTTRQEQHTKNYILERSYTGNQFEQVAIIPAAGNSSTPRQYSFNDRSPVTGKTIYYRLKQTDLDSSFTYSKIITVSCDDDGGIYLYPNPAERHVTVALKNDKIYSVTIFDAQGRVVLNVIQANPAGTITVNVRPLQMGLYWMVVDTGKRKLARMFAR